MRHKVSTTQSTQVHGPLIEMEISRGSKSQSNTEKSHNSPPGISLVFNQEENMLTDKRRKDLEESYTVLNNKIDLRKHELSLHTEASREAEETSCSDKNESGANMNELGLISTPKLSTLGISLKDSNVTSTETTKEVDGQGGFVKIALDSAVGKIIDTFNTNDEPQQEKPLIDWIKDLLVKQVPKEDLPISSESSI